MTPLINNRLYLLDNRYSSKTLKPSSNTQGAGIITATRDPNNVANFLFRAEAYGFSAPNWFRLKHEATGLYLCSPTANDGEQLTLESGGNNVFDIASDGNGFTLRPTSTPTGYVSINNLAENTPAILGVSNTVFDLLLYTPVSVTAPSISGRLFRHFQSLTVNGIAGGAIVRVIKNNSQIAQITDTYLTGTLSIPISGLQVGDSVKVSQEVGGIVSEFSSAEIVIQYAKVRQVASDKYQAIEMKVSNSNVENIDTWIGDEGDAVGPERNSIIEALQDLTDANFILTTIP